MSIYTKRGDNGSSDLFDKKGLKKYEFEFEVIGTLDELNSILGFVQTSRQKRIKELVLKVQGELFEIGTIIADNHFTKEESNIWEKRLIDLETMIDDLDSKNEKLKNFILPGGSSLSSQLHLSRAVSRRLERRFTKLCEKNRPDLLVIQKYINRLSDLLFVMARYANKRLGIKDIVWKKT